ncbi:MAG: hypothetical protein PHD32_01335 [Eubacteriales bacterium]|nr:hypothetical protein [Eubacteriales bacterium]
MRPIGLKDISGQELALLGSLIATYLSTDLDIDEMNLLGNLLSVVSSSLFTIAAQQELQQDDQQGLIPSP